MVLRRRRIQDSRADKAFYAVNGVVMVLLFVLYAWPLWFVLIASVSDPNLVQAGEVLLWPKGFHLEGYKLIVEYKDILRGYFNSVVYTVAGTAINLVMTIFAAYPLSRKDFMPRKTLAALFIFTMYFSGGLIPTYMMVRRLHLLNTIWALIIPGCVSTYNMLLLRSYFVSMPDELLEAAEVDGCGPLRTLVQIALPLSLPVTMSVMLFYMVTYWNTYYAYYYYCYDKALRPLQVVLMDLIRSATGEAEADEFVPTITVQMAAVVFSCVPIVCVYPFIQKYFTTGIMLGAVKG